MKSRLLLTALATIGLFIIDGATANAAEDYTWTGATNSDWNENDNWVITSTGIAPADGVFPGFVADDTATIPERPANQPVLNVDLVDPDTPFALDRLIIRDGATVTTGAYDMEIEEPGGLTIGSDGTLDVSAAGGVLLLTGGGTHIVHGTINLADVSTTTLRITTNDITLAGDGVIVGNGNTNSKIEIHTKTFTNRMTIRGKLTITKDTTAGKFVNEGLVHANATDAGSILALLENTYERGEGGEYKVSQANSTLRFGAVANPTATATGLQSDFTVEAGTLDANVDVITSGNMYYTGGTIDCSPSGVECIFENGIFQG